MARNFNGTSDHLTYAGAVVAYPYTFACWVRPTNLTGARDHMSASAVGVDTIDWLQTNGTTHKYVASNSGSVTIVGGTVTINQWFHSCIVVAGVADRRLFTDGAKVTSTTDIGNPGSGEFNLGRYTGSVPAGLEWFAGDLAEAAAWNIALSDADVAALNLGISPLFVRPDALTSYWPLLGQGSPEPDFRGKKALTATGTTVVAHPSIVYPDYNFVAPKFGAALGTAGRTLAVFTPEENQPPTSNFMVQVNRNNHRLLEAAAASNEVAIFAGVMPRAAYLGGRITCTIHYIAKTAISGTAGWDVSVERDNAANNDLDADNWISVLPTPLGTVDAVSGKVMTASVTLTPSADLASLAAGDPFRIRVRNLAPGTGTGGNQILAIELKET